MKTGVLVSLIVAGGLVVSGGIVTAIAFANGAFRQDKGNITKEHKIEESFKSFDIKADVSKISFKKSEDSTTKVVCVEKEKLYHKVNVKDGTLKIEQVDEYRWYEKVFWNFNQSVTIYLPEESYENLKIRNSTGDIDSEVALSLSEVDIKVSTGDINISNINVDKKIEVKTSTGDMNFKHIKSESLDLTSDTGYIKVEDAKVNTYVTSSTSTGGKSFTNVRCDSASFESSTGHTTLDDFIVTGHLSMESSTGGVTLKNSDANTLKIKTSTGSVKGNLLTDKLFRCTSRTGHVDTPPTSGPICEVETSTGDIILSVGAN